MPPPDRHFANAAIFTQTTGMETYAIIDEQGGWLINIIKWDGNLENWHPPAGTRAVLAEEVDFTTIPQKPE